MKIPKSRATELINEKISGFKSLNSMIHNPQYAVYIFQHGDEIYQKVYYETVNLLTELFSEGEAKNFEAAAADIEYFKRGAGAQGTNFKKHVEKCIIQLIAYKERIQKFWLDDEDGTIRKIIIPFISMSFRDEDSDINNYFTGILEALQIEFETGERYSKESIPEKVKNRIKSSDLLIGILVKRDETINGRYKTPEWLIKEIGIAQGAGKDVIVLVERGVVDIAGLRSEKEIIYFERDNAKEIQTATIKFLEALKEHDLV